MQMQHNVGIVKSRLFDVLDQVAI